MQWSDGANAGFTRATPWLPVPPSAAAHNVARESRDADSILQFYKHLLALRHQNRALLDGDYVPLNPEDPNVLSYLRRYQGEAVLVVLNMSANAQKVRLDLEPQGFPAARAQTLLSTAGQGESAISALSLEPFAVYIAEISK
jgi:oligo-1,6-glucosidase